MPRVTAEFYKPVVADGDEPFADVLERIARLNSVQRIRGAPDPAGIFALSRTTGDFVGEAARVRMEDLPRIVDLQTGDRSDLDMSSQQGLGEEIHFLYDSTIDVIAVQKRLHMRASALRDLISDLGQRRIDFEIVLREDAWERFQRMPLVKKIYFKLARPQDVAAQRRRPSLRRVFQEINEFDGVMAKVEISVQRQRRGLTLGSVRAMIESYRENPDDFEALSITGAVRDGSEETVETVDFIKGRLQYAEEVERRGRRLNPAGCRLVLGRGIRTYRAYLRRYRA
jgi:hypothetical protein